MTKPPAMPELPEKLIFSKRLAISEAAQVPMDAECCRVIQATLDYIRSNYALAALQSAQPAEVSDEVIEEIARGKSNHIEFARAILALRPQAVPMTEDKFVACLVKANCIGVVKMSYDSGPYYVTRPSINASKLKEAIEAHHGITQRADGGEKQA